ncbi:Solute carrier family 22 member 23 [Chelonia mydas]|uniref:Solute carrier family 22 member 23 n=1 Tax=Chelonia mydas TaxID=8469 RepID=M7BLS2_CHEMY|nr:Solute carrier family 22 member 23 [Chelonia mydas]
MTPLALCFVLAIPVCSMHMECFAIREKKKRPDLILLQQKQPPAMNSSTVRFVRGRVVEGGVCCVTLVMMETLCQKGIELCPPGHRFMVTMVASFIAMAGQFLMPGLAALCRDWQVLQAVIICPILLMLLYWVCQLSHYGYNCFMAYSCFSAQAYFAVAAAEKHCLLSGNRGCCAQWVVGQLYAASLLLPGSSASLRITAVWQRLALSRGEEQEADVHFQDMANQHKRVEGILKVYREKMQIELQRQSAERPLPQSVHRMDDARGMKLLSVGSLPHLLQKLEELEKELTRRPKKVCIVKVVGTRNLWKNIVVLCVNSLTGFGIHHCFAKSMMGHEAKMTITHNFYADYYTMAGIALASCLAMCPVVGFLGRRGGLLLFMILTALASLLQLGLLNCMSDSVKDKFSTAFSIVGMFSSHAVGSLSVFFCAEITPTVIRGGGLGLVLASAGFGMLTAPIMELHNQKGYFLHHVIFACCTLICIICILLLPESKNQNLPENIPDGEHYTRKPLLPHKKGEQPLLLTNSELKDYSGLHDSSAVGDGVSENTTANGM